MQKTILTIAVPCFNEEEVFEQTMGNLRTVLRDLMEENLISEQSQLLFIDDGSKDATWEKIENATLFDPLVSGIKLSRNFGHQRALLAGLEEAVKFSDCVISIDADLQDDTSVIRDFIIEYLKGNEIVYGVRSKRETDTFFKRNTAQGFYRLMEKMGLSLVYNHADYRLLSKRAIEEMLRFKESNLFLRGIVPLLGFKSTKVYYERKERAAGESKYPFRKMIAFALDGITSFSVKPIRLITILGFLFSVISVFAGVYAIVQKFMGHTESGWTSIMISVWLLGGLMLMSIGLIGEYIGKIYEEVKQRPRYIIESNLCKKIENRSKVQSR
ncbi:glycosyltransferase [Niallia circulans]|jgi:polyisoprenyl-phosphate glycosyltransferase|uniref:Glycosyltransferase n=1 Tax=Niallia circulans TaxID=1397 RepID=A0A0J1IBX3_NIACI|nr:glycosyltransferase family 2 protein [Niallia circulans]KLV23464.1 glycosyltransferase [Niallia circulans]MCM2981993.1 glycosyltransferase family 2 protein [Niallia circulans]MDR4316276.1 glycosyltransferase family 2 protein [Niallia circulans]MED3838553.1 glycosyltransferase family 2 protein [Niallia circulans]MED4244027.1 glycosyltransferase family 2 protein [Niallia circulans]